MITALFIGRFQPFHAGHLSVLQQLHREGKRVIIGIGSAQYQRTPENPLSAAERQQYIEKVLAKRSDVPARNYIYIPDIHNDQQWVDYVNTIIQQQHLHYDEVITGNNWVKGLYEDKDYIVKPVAVTVPVDGTHIREAIRRNDHQWEQYVDPLIQQSIASIIDGTHGQDSTDSPD